MICIRKKIVCSLLRALTDCVFRHVDDVLMLLSIHPDNNLAEVAEHILEVFKSTVKKRNFTFKLPENSSLQFLDIRLFFKDVDHMCLVYQPSV